MAPRILLLNNCIFSVLVTTNIFRFGLYGCCFAEMKIKLETYLLHVFDLRFLSFAIFLVRVSNSFTVFPLIKTTLRLFNFEGLECGALF